MENKLKHQPIIKELAPGVKQIQNIRQANSDLSYIEFQILELEKGASYKETGSQQEVCIVVLTGKIKVKAADTWYEDLGTRESVFEKIPTDSIYPSGAFVRTCGNYRQCPIGALLFTSEKSFADKCDSRGG